MGAGKGDGPGCCGFANAPVRAYGRRPMAASASPRRRARAPRSRGPGPLGLVARVLSLAALLWVAGFVLFVLRLPGPAAPDTRTDGVAVLTGGPGRVARGVAVLEAGAARRLLVSGVDPAVRPPEFEAAAGVAPGLMACCVDLGYTADSTATNAVEVADWAVRHRLASVRLVTAAYHLPRARLELAARLPAPIRIVPDGVRAGLPLGAMLVEYAKLQVAWLRLRVRPI